MYRYVCDECGYETTVMHGINETPEIVCEECGAKMRKAIGKVGIIFKGSGFYITDSKRSEKKKETTVSSSEKEN
ncbi:FmdB family zinc ribbon protein [Thermotoga sp. KOL6]|uniref:FmdB family zinc ribbon protein n=1 Tax=Thermotoga sp. KOL6 TaxID=126741 RepID=UPI001E5739F7|nr:FmdB family zinc ribbon protein [Thermotoga sp. KOL6]